MCAKVVGRERQVKKAEGERREKGKDSVRADERREGGRDIQNIYIGRGVQHEQETYKRVVQRREEQR